MTDTISSRTPEGVPNHCPVCQADIRLEPSQTAGDAPCPNCGALLWFATTGAGKVYYEAQAVAPIRERVFDLVAEFLRWPRGQISESTSLAAAPRSDSLDVVELVMDMEEEFGATVPDGEPPAIRTVGDLIQYLMQWQTKGSC